MRAGCRLGMCLRDLFYTFSAYSKKYRAAEADAKWRSFPVGGESRGLGLGLGTLFHEARESGWVGLDARRLWEAYRETAGQDEEAARNSFGPDTDPENLED